MQLAERGGVAVVTDATVQARGLVVEGAQVCDLLTSMSGQIRILLVGIARELTRQSRSYGRSCRVRPAMCAGRPIVRAGCRSALDRLTIQKVAYVENL